MIKHSLVAAAFFSTLGISTAAAAARTPDQMRAVQIRGDVQVCDRSNTCNTAQEGQVLNQGDIIKVGSEGRAKLKYGDKDTFEIRERSRVLIDNLTPRGSRLELFIGTLKAKVKSGLFSRRDVSVVTPVGVMAVRGTEFMAQADPSGNVQMDVLYGQVDLMGFDGGRKDSFIQGESGNAQGEGYGDYDGGGNQGGGDFGGGQGEGQGGDQGQGGQEGQGGGQDRRGGDTGGRRGGGDTGPVKRGGISNDSFAEGFGGAEGFNAYNNARNDSNNRAQDFAGNEKAAVDNVVNSVREDDLTSGRTLIDHHGNLVRVEQRLQRPDSSTLQFVNFVKRDEYTYKGFVGFDPGSSATGARKDYIKATVTFNKDLPESIADWPAFFSENSDTLKVKAMNAELANGIESTAKDYIKFNTAYNSVKDEVGGAECTGEIALGNGCFQETLIGFVKGTDTGEWRVSDCKSSNCGTQVNETDKLHGGDVADGGNGSGDAFARAAAPINVEKENSDTLNLITPSNSAAEMWLLTESFGIDNGGVTLNVNSILGSNITDPFAFLKSIGVQTIMSVRTSAGGAYTTTNVFKNKGNIDLVIIPDLMVDMVQKYAGQLAGGI